jgi:hypothetical protein
MSFQFSRHAQDEMRRRRIPQHVVDDVLQHPQQIVSTPDGKKAYQSQIDFGGRIFLVRAIVAEDVDPPLVVTLYRTTKIAKYWRTP